MNKNCQDNGIWWLTMRGAIVLLIVNTCVSIYSLCRIFLFHFIFPLSILACVYFWEKKNRTACEAKYLIRRIIWWKAFRGSESHGHQQFSFCLPSSPIQYDYEIIQHDNLLQLQHNIPAKQKRNFTLSIHWIRAFIVFLFVSMVFGKAFVEHAYLLGIFNNSISQKCGMALQKISEPKCRFYTHGNRRRSNCDFSKVFNLLSAFLNSTWLEIWARQNIWICPIEIELPDCITCRRE